MAKARHMDKPNINDTCSSNGSKQEKVNIIEQQSSLLQAHIIYESLKQQRWVRRGHLPWELMEDVEKELKNSSSNKQKL